MYKLLFEAHSGFRYVVFILLIAALLVAFSGWQGNKGYTNNNRKMYLFALISAHIQLLLGLLLYFTSPNVNFDMGTSMKDAALRYWTVEHILMMIIAVVLITVGHSKSKKALNDIAKHKTIAIFYTIAFIVIIVTILMSGRGLLTMTH